MTRRPWIVAHRGDTSCGWENTLAAFRGAISAGADGVELDVHRLADGVLVVHHDDTFAGMPLARMSYANLYERALEFGIDVPTLAQVLSTCAGRTRLDVELKSDCGHQVVEALLRAPMRVDDYVVSSFDAHALARLRRDHPGLQLAWLTEDLGLDRARPQLELIGADLWAPDVRALDAVTLERCAERGLGVLPWTVNADADLRRLLAAPSVVGIITDHPREALAVRRQMGG